MVTEVVKVDSKGRVLIPEGMREAEGIKPGAPIQVVDLGGGVLAVRKLELPSREDILKICKETRRDIYEKRVKPWLEKALKPKKHC